MKKMASGKDSTLGEWRDIAVIAFGEDSRPVAFLDDKIAVQGADAEVITDEKQVFYLLAGIHVGKATVDKTTEI